MNKIADWARVLSADLISDCGHEVEITEISASSAACRTGSMFFAIAGAKHDGHNFIHDALQRGASVVVVSDLKRLPSGVTGLLVADVRCAWSSACARWFENPSQRLPVFAITGTNGKTTTNWLVHYVLKRVLGASLRSGTLGQHAEAGEKILFDRDAGLTTPDSYLLQRDLAEAMRGGVAAAVFEASSHAIGQARFDDISVDVAVFTNLTRDHLDYHGDMESYFRAKVRLFELLATRGKGVKTAVINLDDSYGSRFLEACQGMSLRTLTYGRHEHAEVRIQHFSQSFAGSNFLLQWGALQFPIKTRAVGIHNAYNIAAAFTALVAQGFPAGQVAEILQAAPQVPGRMECVADKPFGVFVDYAHTPDALENVLRCARGVIDSAGQGSLWVVFGCGGDRDRGKRPQMARIAADLADHVVVTSDNPRTEDPQTIINDILSSGITPSLVQANRASAIRDTLMRAQAKDLVIIAGKGHEDYQIIGTDKIHFSDREEVEKVLNE